MVSITPSRRLLVNCVQVWFDSHISLIYVLISQSFYLKLSLIHCMWLKSLVCVSLWFSILAFVLKLPQVIEHRP